MNTRIIFTTIASLALLTTGAIPAFAEDGSVTTSTTNSVSPRPLLAPHIEGGRAMVKPPEMHANASTTIRTNLMASSSLEVRGRVDLRQGSSTSGRTMGDKEEAARTGADRELDNRAASLTKLLARINAMAHLTADQKTAITASINAQIQSLTTLKTTIDGDTASSTLRTDIQSITKNYRIYALVEPQIAVLVAADRAAGIADMLTTLSTKISSRIATSTNAATLQPIVDDLKAKIADAQTQAQAAIAETASLKPDNGDKTIAAANTVALKDARTKLQVADKDLRAAQQDVNKILYGLKGGKPPQAEHPIVTASSTTTVETH